MNKTQEILTDFSYLPEAVRELATKMEKEKIQKREEQRQIFMKELRELNQKWAIENGYRSTPEQIEQTVIKKEIVTT
jgi:predicted transcriptional regulator